MAILGAHMSISGGYYRSVEIAHEHGGDCVQLFTKNNNQWKAKPITADEVARFQGKLQELKIGAPIAHNSYLINLAAPAEELWRKSIDAHRVELERAEQLGIPFVVAHPGAFTTSSEEEGLRKIIVALDEIHSATPGLKVRTLLETTAGQGSCLGHRFEHLATIIAGVQQPERLGVCVDTCHIFAGGYPLATKKDYANTMRLLADVIGIEQVRAFHLNDSMKPLGSRVDRHAHIGQGCIGLEPFRYLMNDERFTSVPMYLETPKEEVDGEHMDRVNMRLLRSLIE